MIKKIIDTMKNVICTNITANSVTINGKKYNVPDGSSITIEGDNITIGSEQVCIGDKVINISIEGSVGTCKTTSGDIHVTGNSGALQSTSGDISVGGNSLDIRTTSGDVEVGGKVEGDITTVSGDIIHH